MKRQWQRQWLWDSKSDSDDVLPSLKPVAGRAVAVVLVVESLESLHLLHDLNRVLLDQGLRINIFKSIIFFIYVLILELEA